MKNRFMLTLVGEDRPGIVAALTGALFESGATLGEASMMRLGNNFTVMVIVESDEGEDRLRELLAPVVQQFTLRLHVDPCRGRSQGVVIPDVRVSVFGADRPGIVAGVTAALAGQDFNILDLESDVGGAPDQPIYILHIEGQSSNGIDAIRDALEPVSAEGVEVEVSEIETLIG